MRKHISLFCVIALLVSLFSLSITNVGATGEEDNHIIADFTSQEKFDAFWNDSAKHLSLDKNTNHTTSVAAGSFDYNANKNAVLFTIKEEQPKVNAGDSRGPDLFYYLKGAENVPVKGNNVLVLKTRYTLKTIAIYGVQVGIGSYTLSIPGKVDNTGNYYPTSDYLVIDTSEENLVSLLTAQKGLTEAQAKALLETATFGQIQIGHNSGTCDTNSTATLEWVGAFANLSDAKVFDASLADTKSPVVAKGNLFYDFTTDADYNENKDTNIVVLSGDNAAYSYDSEVGALKISTVDGGTTNIGGVTFKPANGIADETEEYRYFAMKVKTANKDLGSLAGLGVHRCGFQTKKSSPTKDSPNYQDIDDWQLLIVEIPDSNDWVSSKLKYLPEGSRVRWHAATPVLTSNTGIVADGQAHDLAWIQWAGTFKTAQDAQTYFMQTTPSVYPTYCDAAGVKLYLDENNNQGLRFYHTLTTKQQDDDRETVTVNGEELTVNRVFVLMSMEDTLEAAEKTELTKDLVGTVDKVVQVPVRTCRSREVDADNNVTYCFTALLTNVANKHKDTYVVCRTYLECFDSQGNLADPVYGNEVVTCVEDMYRSIGTDKFPTEVQNWMRGADTNFLVDFNDETQTGSLTIPNSNKTSVVYAESENAVLVSPKNDGESQSAAVIFKAVGTGVDTATYPIFAMRVKLKNSDSKFGSFSWTTEGSEALNAAIGKIEISQSALNENTNTDNDSVGVTTWKALRGATTTMTYEAKSDWQIVYADFSSVHNPVFRGGWTAVMLNLLANGASASEGVYIDWMGAFMTVKDAYNYANQKEEAPLLVEYDTNLSETEQKAREDALLVNNDLGGDSLTSLPNAESFLVNDRTPGQVDFQHHPSLVYYKDTFYAGFSNGVKDEDAPGQKMVYCTSKDGITWDGPFDIVTPQATTLSGYSGQTAIIGDFFVKNDVLYCSYTERHYKSGNFDANGNFNLTGSAGSVDKQYYMYLKDDGTWSSLHNASSTNRYGHVFTSKYSKIPDRLYSLCGVFLHHSDDGGVTWKICDDPDDESTYYKPTGDQIASSRARAARYGGSLTETSAYISNDGVVHLCVRSESGYVWEYKSYDGGETFTEAYPTNIASASTMFKFVNLGEEYDNRILWIGSPYFDVRWPLTVYVSDDGYDFNRGYILSNEVYAQEEKTGYAKGGYLAYPDAVVVGDYLYVLYSMQKEVMKISRVPLSDLL